MPQQSGSGRPLSRFPLFFWAAAALAASADLLTKHLVFERLPEKTSLPIVIVEGLLRIVHSENEGGVFGLGQGSGLWLVFGLLAGAAVIWFAHRKDARAVTLQIALGLVLAGAIGNVHDRVALGYVRDFIDVFWRSWHWPAFNVADAGICVGAAWLTLHALFFAPPHQPATKQARRK